MENICLTSHISPLMYESVYNEYLFNKIQQEQTLTNMINKQLIMTESTTLVQKEAKLSALYEAKLGDKAKSTWNKFVDFINNLFYKFMETITNLLFSYKKYLTKYKDIILNKKFKISLTEPLPGNYMVGTKRCFNVNIPLFNYNEQNMKALQSDEDLDALKLIIKDIAPKYDRGKDLNENLKDYFLGIDAGAIDDIEKLDRKTMYDFCYNEEKIKNNGEKDLKTLKETTNTIERAIKAELQKVEQEGGTGNTESKEENKEQTQKQNNTTSTGEAYTINYGEPLHEDGFAKVNDKRVNPNAAKEAKKSSFSKVNDNRASAGAAKKADQSTQQSTQKNTNNNNEKQGSEAAGHVKITNTNPVNSSLDSGYKGELDKDNFKQQGQNANAAKETEESINDAFDKWRNICRAVITAKMTAQEAIAKDYMNIIRAHVRSYVGKKADEMDNEQSNGTNYGEKQPSNEENK